MTFLKWKHIQGKTEWKLGGNPVHSSTLSKYMEKKIYF